MCQSPISDASSTSVGDEHAGFLEFEKTPHVLLKRIPRACRLRVPFVFAECLRLVISSGRLKDWKKLLIWSQHT